VQGRGSLISGSEKDLDSPPREKAGQAMSLEDSLGPYRGKKDAAKGRGCMLRRTFPIRSMGFFQKENRISLLPRCIGIAPRRKGEG